MVISHNLTAMNSSRQLNITTNLQAKSSEKLSSGYRINRAADDAAGLAISEKMRRQIRGLNQASYNAQDGISMVQTAEGALDEVHSMLQRMNELCVKASNDTLDRNDRDYIQQELSQIVNEIDRVAESTEFNTIPLLKGSDGITQAESLNKNASASSSNISITINDPSKIKTNATYTFTGTEITTRIDNSTGVPHEVSSNDWNHNNPITVELTETGKSASIPSVWGNEGQEIDAFYLYACNANGNAEGWYAFDNQRPRNLYNVTDYISVTSGTPSMSDYYTIGSPQTGMGNVNLLVTQVLDRVIGIGNLNVATNCVRLVHGIEKSEIQNGWKKNGGYASDQDYFYSNSSEMNEAWGVSYTGDPQIGDTISFSVTDASGAQIDESDRIVRLQVGSESNLNNTIAIHLKKMNATVLGVQSIDVRGASGNNARNAIFSVKNGIETVSSYRAYLGAKQNRLEHTVRNLNNVVENTSSSESIIRDTDIAKEMVRYSNNNILAQAGQSILAQANQSNQGVLSLLQ